MPSCIDTETPELANTLIMGAWNLGYHGAAVAAAIAYDTGLSPVDVRTLTVGELQGNRIKRDRTKTGRTVDLELWPNTLEWIEAYHKELGIAQMPGALIVRTRRGKPFTKDMLATDIRQVREKLGIPSELKLVDLPWTPRKEHKRDRKVRKVGKSLAGLIQKLEKWRE